LKPKIASSEFTKLLAESIKRSVYEEEGGKITVGPVNEQHGRSKFYFALNSNVALHGRAVPKFIFKPQTDVLSELEREITSNLGN
jgi:hypothetical protein